MEIRVGDRLIMKKAHPCGSQEWVVTRIGADLGLRCLGCGHEIMGLRYKIEKQIRQIEHKEPDT